MDYRQVICHGNKVLIRVPYIFFVLILMFYWEVKWIISNEISKCHFHLLIAQNYSFQVCRDKNDSARAVKRCLCQMFLRLGINRLTLIQQDK